MTVSNRILAFLTLAVMLAPIPSMASDVFECNFQSSYAGPHVLNVELFQPAVANIHKKSDGKLNLNFFMSNAIVKASESIPAVINGSLDMAGVVSYFQDTMFPNTHILEVPYVTRDSVQASALYWKAFNEIPEIKAEWDKVGKVLTIWGSDRSGIFSTKGPIRSPADLKGKRVLIWNGGQVDQIKAWGGIPVQVTAGDTYLGLQRGMGDIFFGPLPTGVAYKLTEVAKDVTVIPATNMLLATIVNWDVWNEMKPEFQQLVMDEMGGEKASIRSGRLLFDATNKDIETMRGIGCAIHILNDAQIQAFRDADRDVINAFWNADLKRLGIADPAAAIKRVFDMAETVPAAK